MPDGSVVSLATYNQMFTMHGTTMVFLVVMPGAAAFFNYLIPLQIGKRRRLSSAELVLVLVLPCGWLDPELRLVDRQRSGDVVGGLRPRPLPPQATPTLGRTFGSSGLPSWRSPRRLRR